MGKQMRLSSDIFTGEGDVVAWLNKLKLIVKLQKIEDIATLIPMYLEGNALVVYLEMGEKDHADAENIEKRLKTAFLGVLLKPITSWEKLAEPGNQWMHTQWK